jgi:hypothetical protein
MSTLLDQVIEELKALPPESREAIAADVLEMIRSERKWDNLFADPRSRAVRRRLADEAAGDDVFDFDPASRQAAPTAHRWRQP